jgi:hypothetical protein
MSRCHGCNAAATAFSRYASSTSRSPTEAQLSHCWVLPGARGTDVVDALAGFKRFPAWMLEPAGLNGRIAELTEPINSYNNLERNFPTEPQRNRAEPISNRS